MTKIAVITDIHSNLEALTAVLEDAEKKGCDKIRCLGDIVNYGPNPTEVVEEIMRRKIQCTMGNHEQMVLGDREIPGKVQSSVMHSRSKLTKRQLAFLRKLPTTMEEDGILYVHAAPLQGKKMEVYYETGRLEKTPETIAYLDRSGYMGQIENLLSLMTGNFKKICFVGHTHLPMLARVTRKRAEYSDKYERGSFVKLQTRKKYIINPGSVGQPRAGNPQSNYAILDTETRQVQLQFVDYDYRETMRKIDEAGLPYENAQRLTVGR